MRDNPGESLIAQAPNGAGKTASFIINSIMLVDRDDPSI